MTTFTSTILEHVNYYRNSAIENNRIRNYGIIALSQAAYIAIIPFALIESALTSLAFLFAKGVLKIRHDRIEPLQRWAARSGSVALWSIHLAVRNLIDKRRLIATEAEWNQGQLFRPQPQQPVQPRTPFWANPQENLLINPSEVKPDIATFLKPYQLGDNAVKYTDVFERIYQDLPNPTVEEIELFSVEIKEMLDKRLKHLDPHLRPINLMYDLVQIAGENPRTPENDHFIKMLICCYKTIMSNNDQDEIEIMNAALIDANSACRTRRNDEVLRLFMTVTAPHLNLPYLNAFTPTDSFIFDLMQHRIKLRDQLLNIAQCNDTHDHNHFCRKLNEKVFHLPFPNLSDEEFRYGNYKENEEEQVVRTFKACYDSPAAVYNIFLGLLYPRTKEIFKYKTSMFVEWLEKNNLMNEEAFADEDMQTYKPPLIIRYLEEHGFLKQAVNA